MSVAVFVYYYIFYNIIDKTAMRYCLKGAVKISPRKIRRG